MAQGERHPAGLTEALGTSGTSRVRAHQRARRPACWAADKVVIDVGDATSWKM